MKLDFEQESPQSVYEFLCYLEIERGLSTATIYNYFIDLRLFFRYLESKKRKTQLEQELDLTSITIEEIRAIRREDISGFLAWLARQRGAGERTRNRKIAVLKSFFNYLLEMEQIEKNIMLKIPTSKTAKTLPKYLQKENISELLEVISGEFWARDTAIILLMMSGGLRVSEVASLNLEDFRGDRVTVMGKGKKERQVYLSERTAQSLERYLDERYESADPAMFLSKRNKRFAIRSIQAMVDKHLTLIGKSDYSCHKLRHTAATQLLKSGANIREIQEILGHASISTTEIYTHISNDDLKRVAKSLEY
ncbi:MAG: tyrosine-type recombinase/integrase [Eubacteriales bacterium]